jgi:hypothetical protein
MRIPLGGAALILRTRQDPASIQSLPGNFCEGTPART